MTQATVIGSGVSGLSCGVRLLEKGFDVTIFTRELPAQTTSAAAGAMWWGYGTGRLREWADTSLTEYQRIAQIDGSGVQIVRLRDVYFQHMPDPWFKGRLPFFERIAPGDLPAGYVDGFAMEIPLIEPPRYLDYLMAWFKRLGGKLEQRTVNTLLEVIQPGCLVVNCTGVGAREVARDPEVYPIRGQLVRVNAPHIREGFMDDASFTYLLPRGDGCALGGVAQPNNWSREVDPAITQDILRRCSKIEPSVKSAEIVGQTVGLRPGRYAVRLEAERLGDQCAVIHNYGHAGIGFTLSWGCAEEVTALAEQIRQEWA